jgi:hypothetical protein
MLMIIYRIELTFDTLIHSALYVEKKIDIVCRLERQCNNGKVTF